jgi:hypothetical protein
VIHGVPYRHLGKCPHERGRVQPISFEGEKVLTGEERRVKMQKNKKGGGKVRGNRS